MVDPKVVELIQREIDGENSPAEQQTLYEYLQHHQEAHRLFEDFRTLATSLEQVEEVDPPRALKARILNLINSNLYGHRESSSGWLERLVESWGSHRYVYVFSTGVAVGAILLLVFLTVPSSQQDQINLTGTLISGKTVEFSPGDAVHTSMEGVELNVQTKYANGIVVAELGVNSKEVVDVLLTVDGIDMYFTAFKQAEGGKGQFVLHENTSRITSVGTQRYLLLFTDKTGTGRPLYLRVEKNGHAVYEKTLLPKR